MVVHVVCMDLSHYLPVINHHLLLHVLLGYLPDSPILGSFPPMDEVYPESSNSFLLATSLTEGIYHFLLPFCLLWPKAVPRNAMDSGILVIEGGSFECLQFEGIDRVGYLDFHLLGSELIVFDHNRVGCFVRLRMKIGPSLRELLLRVDLGPYLGGMLLPDCLLGLDLRRDLYFVCSCV